MRKGIVSILLWTATAWALVQGYGLGEIADLWARGSDRIEKELREKRKNLKEVDKQLSLTRRKEKEIRGKESSVLDSLNRIETELHGREKELRQMEGQLRLTEEKLDHTRTQIRLLYQATEETKGKLFSRLDALYRTGRMPPEATPFTSEPYRDRLKIDKYLRVVVDFDTHLVNTYHHQVLLKETYQKELLEDQAAWQRSIAEVRKKRAEIAQIRKEKQALLRSIQNQKAVYRKLISELTGRSKELQSLIDRLEKQKSKLGEERERSEVARGRLLPPLEGNVVSLFKEKGQNGIEISAPMGSEVRAVLPGKVLYADWFKGFGNMVIIDHGNHLFTVSAYCSSLLKKVGDTVTQGEAIARVGTAGSLRGPCLYFEIRLHGRPQDPLAWLPHLDRRRVVALPEGQPVESRKGL